MFAARHASSVRLSTALSRPALCGSDFDFEGESFASFFENPNLTVLLSERDTEALERMDLDEHLLNHYLPKQF